jgi:hypothetical protein
MQFFEQLVSFGVSSDGAGSTDTLVCSVSLSCLSETNATGPLIGQQLWVLLSAFHVQAAGAMTCPLTH